MKITSKFIGITIVSCLLFLTFNANAKERFVSQKVINSKGLKIMVKGKPFIITKIINKKNPKKLCRLDVNSLSFLSLKLMPKKGFTTQISLQAKSDSKGVFCAGKGDGCLITVELPDPPVESQKLMQ